MKGFENHGRMTHASSHCRRWSCLARAGSVRLRRRRRGASRLLAAAISVATPIVLLASCRPPAPAEEVPLETVEVDRGPTATLVPDDDPVEARSGGTLAGLLPGDYPADLPSPKPASVIDFGAASADRSYVVLHTDRTADETRASLVAALDASAWRRDGGALRRTKGNLVAIFEIRDGERGGAEIRVEYGLATP